MQILDKKYTPQLIDEIRINLEDFFKMYTGEDVKIGALISVINKMKKQKRSYDDIKNFTEHAFKYLNLDENQKNIILEYAMSKATKKISDNIYEIKKIKNSDFIVQKLGKFLDSVDNKLVYSYIAKNVLLQYTDEIEKYYNTVLKDRNDVFYTYLENLGVFNIIDDAFKSAEN